jgi:glycosyltransferase involved in cell wall biosynthesis
MFFKKGFLFYKFFNVRLFFHLLTNKYDLLVANDLDTLLPNYLVSKFKSLPLVYDSHEYFTGVPELQNRPFVRWVWQTIEKQIFPRLNHIMTVSDSIAIQYESEYGIKPFIVRNCSRNSKNIIAFSRKEIGIKEDQLLLILQGAGINIDRGGEELIEAISKTTDVALLIVGSGDVLTILKAKAIKLGVTHLVKFVPKVPWDELIRYTKAADAGLSLDKNTNTNYRYSLPNKLFDYISSGIPVIASNLAEIEKIINQNNCGIIISEVTSEEISKAIMKIKDDPEFLKELKQNAIKASEYLNWERESLKVEDFYRSIIE